jgi:membrane protease YdiL (CAAX protease family)
MNTKPALLERYSLPIFLILTPVLSLGIPLFLPLPPELVPLLMVFIPALLAILLTAITEGRKGIAKLLGRLLRWRIGFKWYAISLGLALGVRLAMGPLALLFGWIPAIELRAWAPQQFLLIGVFSLIGAILEELGWRGYALPGLMANRSALVSALLIGIPWGVLHLGLTLPGMMNAGTPWTATMLQILGLSVVLTWLFVQTRGSLVAGILYHAGQNFFVFLNGGLTSSQDLWLLTFVTAALALILIALFGTHLQRSPAKEPAGIAVGQVK